VDKTDAYDLQRGVVYTLNSKNRWEIPAMVEKEMERTLALLKEDKLDKDPLVLVMYVDKPLYNYTNFGGRPSSKGLDETAEAYYKPFGREEEEEEEREVEIVLTRKGRKVVETGSRSDKKEREHKLNHCSILEERFPQASDFDGNMFIYRIMDPKQVDNIRKKFPRHICRCERCIPAIEDTRGKNQKRSDALSSNVS